MAGQVCTGPFRTISQFTVALGVSWREALLAFETRCFGGLLSGACLKSWGARCGRSNPLLFREKLGVVSSLPIVGHHARSGVYGQIMSRLLLPVSRVFLLIAQCVGVTQAASGFLRRQSICYVVVVWRSWVQISPTSPSWTGSRRFIFICVTNSHRTTCARHASEHFKNMNSCWRRWGTDRSREKLEENKVAWHLGKGFAGADLTQQNMDLLSDFEEAESRAEVLSAP